MRNEKWVAKITLLMTHSVYMLAATVYFLILFKDKPGWLMFSHMEVIITPTDKMSQMLKVTFVRALDSQLPYHLIL